MNIKQKFGTRIYTLCQNSGMSQKCIAANSDVASCYLSRVIKGDCNISIVNMEKTAKGFGISVRQLINDNLFD